MTSSPTCSICCEKLNKSNRRYINCYCKYPQCSQCAETYLTSTIENAHCMNCRREWDMEFLHANFTSVFMIGKFKKHREKILVEREKSRFPETMPYVEKTLYIRRVMEWIDTTERLAIADFHGNIANVEMNIRRDYLRSARSLQTSRLFASIRFSRAYIAELLRNPDMLHDETVDYRFERIYEVTAAIQSEDGVAQEAAAAVQARKRFVRACTAEGCRGFLSTAWKCGLCECWTCPTCHEFIGKVKGDNHVCNPDNVETARLLNQDSRPCPNCASLIFKISGCDQMFCTQCSTAFDWKTGRSLNMRNVHNPHYFEFMRRQREQHDQDAVVAVDTEAAPLNCREMPPLARINDRECAMELPLHGDADNELTFFCRTRRIFRPHRLMSSIMRLYNHITNVTMNQYLPANHEQNRDLRILYMLNEISDEKFKQTLHSREKRENIKNETRLVFEMFSHSCIDMVHRMMAAQNKNYSDLCREFVALYDYSTECLKNIAKRYKVVQSTIELHEF